MSLAKFLQMEEEGEALILEWEVLNYRTGEKKLKVLVYDDYAE